MVRTGRVAERLISLGVTSLRVEPDGTITAAIGPKLPGLDPSPSTIEAAQAVAEAEMYHSADE